MAQAQTKTKPQEMEGAAGQGRQRPDFNSMTRADMLENFGATVDNSNMTGTGENRHPRKYLLLRVTRAEVNAALSQVKGTQSRDLEDAEGRKRSVVDTLRTFVSAARADEYVRGPDKKSVPTNNVFTGAHALESLSSGFGQGGSRSIGFDREALKGVMAAMPERADVQEALLQFRGAQGHTINRERGLANARGASRADSMER